MFNVRGSGVDTASDVRFGGVLAGITFENCAIESKEIVSFVSEESSLFGVNDIFFSESYRQKKREMIYDSGAKLKNLARMHVTFV